MTVNTVKHDPYPLTLLYDASCPLCALEMDELRALDGGRRLRLIDFSAPGFDPAAYGATHAALDARLHGLGADGRWYIGMEAIRLAYGAVGLGFLRPTGHGLLRPLFDRLYAVFARHRQPISRAARPLIAWLRRRRARRAAAAIGACRDGLCARPASVAAGLAGASGGTRREAGAATGPDRAREEAAS